ncbi:MAG: DNA recombination protein RmuC [Clostridia bacterium]
MTGIYILLAICICLLAFTAVFLVVFCAIFIKKSKSTVGVNVADLQAENEKIKNEIQTTVKMENAMLTGSLNTQIQSTKDITNRFDIFMNNVDTKLEKLKDDNAKNLADIRDSNTKNLADIKDSNAKTLGEVRDDNTKSIAELRADNTVQLEKMRETVDEKLSSTLDTRFNQSFKIVGDRLEAINRSFADLQNLQTGVNDLKSIFKNVKTRGTWGEVALENLLSQILTTDQYEKQYNLSRTGNEPVDFAIKLPGKGDGEVVLPLDAKFPVEDYQRLVEASENGDIEGVEAAGKAIEKRIKSEAQSIRDKYIKPPKTTDFAIMYLPIEGLFAEVVKRKGLTEDLQNRCRVVVCGPTTLAALLNSLQMGFRSVAIEKRSTEIGKLLNAFVGDFDKFSTLLQKTSKTLEGVQNTISRANDRTAIIRKKLNKVGRLTDNDGEPLAIAPTKLDVDEEFAEENVDDVNEEFDAVDTDDTDEN